MRLWHYGILGVALLTIFALAFLSSRASLPETEEPLPPIYRNAEYHFELTPPPMSTITEYAGPESSLTVEFVDTATNNRFQVFVIPYGNSTISEQRFALDLPSGVRDELTEIVVDDKPAIMFFSFDEALGETREVWFLHHGFLYEVTAPKALDAWLADIMTTWEML